MQLNHKKPSYFTFNYLYILTELILHRLLFTLKRYLDLKVLLSFLPSVRGNRCIGTLDFSYLELFGLCRLRHDILFAVIISNLHSINLQVSYI
jgi:hypothetical protein